jgi:hypothetical protein
MVQVSLDWAAGRRRTAGFVDHMPARSQWPALLCIDSASPALTPLIFQPAGLQYCGLSDSIPFSPIIVEQIDGGLSLARSTA